MVSLGKKNQWHIDNGCQRHMKGDQLKFLSLKEENWGSVTFGNNAYAKIVGKGEIILEDNNTKV